MYSSMSGMIDSVVLTLIPTISPMRAPVRQAMVGDKKG